MHVDTIFVNYSHNISRDRIASRRYNYNEYILIIPIKYIIIYIPINLSYVYLLIKFHIE
jgi:hypothetical protein